MIELQLQYSRAQNTIFFQSKARRRIIHKGRRLGLTRGAAQASIEEMLEYPGMYMWGDTINSNIDRYVSRYFDPVGKQINKAKPGLYNWNSQKRILHVGESQMDFRSADRPENWEGFGYRWIFLNEAGIILKDEYLWENAVQPMLLDHPDSVCIIGGTPKGRNKFWELAMRGYSAAHSEWETMQFSTYDNPWLDIAEIKKMEGDMPAEVVKQEIYGEFLDTTENQLIPAGLVDEAIARELEEDQYIFQPLIMGVDVARFGDDQSVLTLRQGRKVLWMKKYGQLSTMDLAATVAAMLTKYPVNTCFVDEVGVGAGVVDRLAQLGFDNVCGVNVGSKAGEETRYFNKRAEIWVKLKEWLEHADIPNDRGLRTDLTGPMYKLDNKERIQLEKKEDMKKRGYNSPDCADSLALTFSMPVVDQIQQHDLEPEVEAHY